MRVLTTLLISLCIPCLTYAQHTVYGKIIDELGLPVYRVAVEIPETKEVVFTDMEGLFSITSGKNFHWKLNINCTGYKSELFFVLDGGKARNIMLEYDVDLNAILEEENGE